MSIIEKHYSSSCCNPCSSCCSKSEVGFQDVRYCGVPLMHVNTYSGESLEAIWHKLNEIVGKLKLSSTLTVRERFIGTQVMQLENVPESVFIVSVGGIVANTSSFTISGKTLTLNTKPSNYEEIIIVYSYINY